MLHDPDRFKAVACDGKQPFESHSCASKAAKRQMSGGKVHVKTMSVYKCDFCSFFHIGRNKAHKPKRLR